MLDIKNIYKNFGDLQVSKGVSTHVEKGEVVVIIGVFFFLTGSSTVYSTVFAVSAGIIGLGFLSTLKLNGRSETDDTKRRLFCFP